MVKSQLRWINEIKLYENVAKYNFRTLLEIHSIYSKDWTSFTAIACKPFSTFESIVDALQCRQRMAADHSAVVVSPGSRAEAI